MARRKPPSPFALARGRLIRRARLEARWSQDRLAKELGLQSREAVSQYESGKIEDISPLVCRQLVAKLGMRPQDLAEDTSVFQFDDELPTMSTEARRLARRWDSLPEGLRKWIAETIDRYGEAPPPPPKPRSQRR